MATLMLVAGEASSANLQAAVSASVGSLNPSDSISFDNSVWDAFFAEGRVEASVPAASSLGARASVGTVYAEAFGFIDDRFPEGQQSRLAFRFSVPSASASTPEEFVTAHGSGAAQASLAVGIEFHDPALRDRLEGTWGTVEHVYRVSGSANARHGIPQGDPRQGPGARGSFFAAATSFGAFGAYGPEPTAEQRARWFDESAEGSFSVNRRVSDPVEAFFFGSGENGVNTWILDVQAGAQLISRRDTGSTSASSALDVEWLGAIVRDAEGNPLPFASFGLFEVIPTAPFGRGATLRTAEAITRIAGDFNANGQVEQGDLNLVLTNWGGPRGDWDNADAFATETVDQEELNRVLSNWGSSAAPSFAGFDVPEPGGALLLGGLLASARRRRRIGV